MVVLPQQLCSVAAEEGSGSGGSRHDCVGKVELLIIRFIVLRVVLFFIRRRILLNPAVQSLSAAV